MNASRTVINGGVSRQLIVATKIGLPASINVIVLVSRRCVPQKHEFIAVAAEAKVEFRIGTDVLLQRRKPGLGPFPRIEWAIELVRAKWLVAKRQHYERTAESGFGSRGREKCGAAVVAIRTKATRKIALSIERLIEFLPDERSRAVLLVDAKVTDAGTQAQIRALRGGGDHVQGSSHRIRAVKRGAGALQYFNSLDGMYGQRKIGIVMCALHIVHAHAVHQDEGFAEA